MLLVTAWRTLAGAGYFKRLDYHQDLDCTPILGVWSSEDITIDPRSGRAYISATDRRPRPDSELPGAVFAFDLREGNTEVVQLASDLEGDFRPHGIGLRIETDRTLLFAVNHRTDRDSVEIFEVEGERLHHLESVVDERFFNLNDVAAAAARSFYVTRDHGGLSAAAQRIEDILALPLSSVLRFDDGRITEAASGISYANGINLSSDGRTVYVAGTRDRLVHVFDRDSATGELAPRTVVETDTGVDNIEVDAEAELWIGAHPKALDFLRYASNPDAQSPAQVLRVSFDEAGVASVEEVMLTDGRFLSGSSVAARWGEYLLVGSVFDRRFLFCRGVE